jgi:hypothetical protein
VAQAEYLRSYLLTDGKLYLSLMADGGIYAWEPDSRRRQHQPSQLLLRIPVCATRKSRVLAVSAPKEADLHMIRVGVERYEIPDSVVLGD